MIRTATVADAAAIAHIYNVYVTETTISFEEEPVTEAEMARRLVEFSAVAPCLVWEEDGRVLGYCYAHKWKDRPAYWRTLETTVYVARDCRGRGIGSALMRRLIEECRAGGQVRALVACITGGNEASIALHRSLGFKQVSCFEKVGYKFGRELDVVDMELLL